MGGEYDERIYYGTFTKEQVKEKLQQDIDQTLYDYGHRGYSGTIAEHSSNIKWSDKSVTNPDEAREIIEELQGSKWNDLVGVFFNGGCVVGGWCSA